MGTIVALLPPFSADALANLLCVPIEEVAETPEDLHSILDVPKINHHRSVRTISHFVTLFSIRRDTLISGRV